MENSERRAVALLGLLLLLLGTVIVVVAIAIGSLIFAF